VSLKTDLIQPQACGAAPDETVELIETHISWVFVVGAHVYKVKKPVDLGFLDFTTSTLRHAACEAEVRLNSRLAPEVYLGVVPVTKDDAGRFSLCSSGEIADWAVHMRRLPDGRRGDILARRGELTAPHMLVLAHEISDFHARSASGVEVQYYGMPDAVLRNVEENFTQTRATIAHYLSESEVSRIQEYQIDFIRRHAPLIERRARSGRVRDGHGDLRLEHVYLPPLRASLGLSPADDSRVERPVIIDCIEFNDRFRYADVCADIAFLSMDCAAHGRRDLGEQLLARYAREASDYDLYALVDFYESYRALVRGKVAAIVAADAGVAGELRDAARKTALNYFRLSLAATCPPVIGPEVVAVGGVIASGKSTIAELVAGALCAPVIDSDRTRKAMLGAQAQQPMRDAAWHGAYEPERTTRAYTEVLRRAAVVVASGRPVVLDASFRSAESRASARELARAHGAPFRFLECRAQSDVCRARLATRALSPSVSDGRLDLFDAFAAAFEPVTELPTHEHVVIATDRPLEQTRARIGALLARGRPAQHP